MVVLSGKIDYISDGTSVAILENGHDFLGKITGSGCMAGSCIASYCAAAMTIAEEDQGKLVSGDMFLGAIGGLVLQDFNVNLC